jgi:hypothetical protein
MDDWLLKVAFPSFWVKPSWKVESALDEDGKVKGKLEAA